MAVRKRTKASTSQNIAPSKQAMLWYVVLIIGVVVFGLTYLWSHLPTRPSFIVKPVQNLQDPNKQQRLTCERAGGKWTDCGSPCHGQNTDTCIAMCEPQCLCGGTPNYTCPVNTVCTNKVSANPGEPAIGVCRAKAAVQATTTQKTTITATLDTSTYPFALRGTVNGTSTAIWWTVTDESATTVGRGTIQWQATSTTSFEQKIFLSAMPTSTVLNVVITTGSEKFETVVTTTKLVPMTRTVYVDDPSPLSDGCDGLSPRTQSMPKTAYPFEAVIRATFGEYLLGFSVTNSIATITVPDEDSFGDRQCPPFFIKDAAREIKRDFPAIKDLVIKEQSAQTQP